MIKIGLDAGHGKHTAGKRCLKSLDPKETREWELNARVVEKIISKLRDYKDCQVIRLDDPTGQIDVPLSLRTGVANKNKVDILVSLHHDAGINGGAGGGTTIYRFPNSTKFTKKMQEDLYNSIIKYTKLKGNRADPLREANFQILRESDAPAVLIENGFMDSTTDVPIILSESHAENTAQGVVEFLVNHFNLVEDKREDTITISLHGKDIEVEGIKVKTDQGAINYVPIRFVENLGYKVDWKDNKITIDYKKTLD